MKTKRIIHGVLLVLGLSVLGLLFYYLMWLITDEEFREMLKQGWPFTSGMILVDYAVCCLFTMVVTLYYWRSREKAERERDKFRLQALENQLSPHFVFNNFSILADLIEVDPKRFMRVNRQFIVSATAVSKLSTYFLGKMRIHMNAAPDEEIIVSKDKVATVKRWLDS